MTPTPLDRAYRVLSRIAPPPDEPAPKQPTQLPTATS